MQLTMKSKYILVNLVKSAHLIVGFHSIDDILMMNRIYCLKYDSGS